MKMIKWNNRNNGMFPSLFGDLETSIGGPWMSNYANTMLPAVNVKEGENSFSVEVAAPGFEKKDFQIELHDNTLKISSEKEHKQEEESEKFTRKEFSYAKFERSFFLPENVEEEGISAKYDSGILKIEIPKKKEAIKKLKEISVS